MNSFDWFDDICWAIRMVRARRHRRRIIFSARRKFDDALRPPIGEGNVIAYPDAFYDADANDMNRAVEASSKTVSAFFDYVNKGAV